MRQLTTLPSADAARALADYLLTLKIDTQIEKQPEGWAIWVRDEDHLPRARQELEEFQRNPSDPRYQGAGSTAAVLRKKKLQEERAYHRRQKRFYARMGRVGTAGGVTLALIAISVIVFLVKDASRFGHSLVQGLSIAPYSYRLISSDPSAGREGIRRELVTPGLGPALHGQIWRLVTPMFLHFGIWHLVFDMWALHLLGGAVERRRGRFRYLALVLVLAVLSNLAQYFLGNVGSGVPLALLPPSPNFGGMSGVAYGLFGYIWMKARFQPDMGLYIDSTAIIIMMAGFFLCFMGWFGPVGNVGHAAGLLAGMLIGYVPTMWRTGR